MQPSIRFLQHACRITLFTRPDCSLCTNAQAVLSKVWDTRPFEYKEIEIMKPDAASWRDIYEFDTPVIHVSRSQLGEERAELASRARKLMHRFTAEDIVEKMDVVEREAESSKS